MTEFELIARPHIESVGRFALSLTRDEADADDLVQETYLRALKGWHTFTPGTDCRRWLFTICRNTFIGFKRQRPAYVLSDEGDVDAMPAAVAHMQAVSEGIADAFDHLDVRPAIEAAVAALPEPHHSIIVLVDLEDLSYEEAAAVLQIPVGTVRSRLYRARRHVQEALLAHARDMGIGNTPRRSPGSQGGSVASSRLETPLDCSEVVRSLWEYLDQRASDGLVEAIDHHLALCEGCRAHFAFEKRLVQTISGLRNEHSDPQRLREEVLKALQGAGLGQRGETTPGPGAGDH